MPMNVSDAVQVVAQAATASAAVGGVLLARKGLSTWRQELRGRAKYETARRILRAVYEVRNGIYIARSPLVREGDEQAAAVRAGSSDRTDVTRAVHAQRWQLVAQPMAAVEEALLDGEVLWGSALSVAFRDLRQAVHELGLSQREWLDGVADPNLQRARGRDRIEQIGSVAIDMGSPEAPDAFQCRIDSIIARIENLLRPDIA